MPYNLKFPVETPGIENLVKVRSEVLGLQEQYKTAAAEVKQAMNRISDAEKQAAEAIALGHKNLAAGIMQAVQQDSQALDGLIRKELELKAAIDQVKSSVDQGNASHEHSVTQIAAVGGAIRTAFGEQSIRSVENFTAKILGLGPLLQTAFPIVGAIAFGEMLVRTLKEMDPLIEAEKKLAETTKKLDGEYANLEKRLERLQVKQLAAQFHASAGKDLEVSQRVTDIYEEKAGVKDLDKQIADAQKRVGVGDILSAAGRLSGLPGGMGLNAVGSRFQAAANDTVLELQRKRDALQFKIGVETQEVGTDQAEAAKDRVSEGKTAASEAAAKAREAVAALRAADEEALADLKSHNQMSVGEVMQYWEKRLKVESDNAERSKDIRIKLGTLHQESDRAVMAVSRHGLDLMMKDAEEARKLEGMLAKLAEEATEVVDKMAKQAADAAAKTAEGVARQETLRGRGDEISGAGSLSLQRLGIQRSVALADPRNRVAAGIGGIAAETNIDRQAADQKIAIEQQALERLEVLGDAGTEKYIEQQNKILEIKAQTSEKIFQDETKLQESLHNERQKELDSFKSGIGQAFDALISGHGIGDFAKKFALGQAKTIVENIAATQFDSIRGAIPRAGAGTTMGGILGGTIFGPDQLAGATASNTAATVANTAATTQLATVIAGGGTAGIGGIGTSGLGSVFGGSTQNPFVFNATGTPNLPFVDGASDINNLSGASTNATRSGGGGGFGIMSGLSHTGDLAGIFTGVGAHETLNTQERIGAGIGTAGVLVGGGMAAFSQFKRGGASGILGGIGASAGTAAALDPEPISKAVLGGVALVSGIISSILPDPKKVREEAIQKAIEQGHYNAPESLSVTQDTSGHYYDMNSRGQIRGSNLSSMPQVNEPYTFWKGNTPYQVPGSVTSPYGSPTINIYAHDSQSFVDMARRNASGLGDVIADHVQNEGSRLSAAIAYRVNR